MIQRYITDVALFPPPPKKKCQTLLKCSEGLMDFFFFIKVRGLEQAQAVFNAGHLH